MCGRSEEGALESVSAVLNPRQRGAQRESHGKISKGIDVPIKPWPSLTFYPKPKQEASLHHNWHAGNGGLYIYGAAVDRET